MRINVSYDSDFQWLKIPIIIKTPHKRIFSFIVFDTGSPNTLTS